MIETGERFCEDFYFLLQRLEPVLPVPASRQDVSDAREKLLKDYEEFMKTFRKCSYQLCDEIGNLSDRIVALILEAQPHRQFTLLASDMDNANHSISQLRRIIESEVQSADDRFVQSVYLRMIEGQETQLRDWFEKEYLDEFSSHLALVRTDFKHMVELRKDVERPSDTRYIPSEIISLIFSFSDLENCVVMRQVCSQWFSVFNDDESLWKTKMKQRNPLMTPGNGDLQSWQDCVLVFAARVQNDRWKTIIDDVEKQNTAIPLQNTVVARHLKKGQLLPSNFASLTAPSVTNSLQEYAFLTGQQRKGVNPWTGDIVDTPITHKIISSDSEEMLVKYNGVSFTLPASTPIRSVRTNRTTIIVQTETFQMYFMSRENPHYKHALIHRELGLVFLVGEDIVLYGINDFNEEQRTFFLVDTEDKTFHRICEQPTDWLPSACYNGVLWWYWYDSDPEDDEVSNSLTPTFSDVEEPQKTYYNSDKMMRGLCQSIRDRQGSRSRDSAHFQILDNTPKGMLIVDLVTGDRTMVTGPYGLRYTCGLFMGFREGKFEAWWVDDSYGEVEGV